MRKPLERVTFGNAARFGNASGFLDQWVGAVVMRGTRVERSERKTSVSSWWVLGNSWYLLGTCLVLAWYLLGSCLVLAWYLLGTCLVLALILLVATQSGVREQGSSLYDRVGPPFWT
jgi:hypothetical protein